VSPLYVYAVVEPGVLLSQVRGLAGEPVQVVECGGVAAAVGAMERGPDVGADALRAHDAAVRAIAEGVPALLPARFGTLVAGHAELREALEPRAGALQAALRGVRDREQMTLRLTAGEGLSEALEPVAAGGPGTRYLASRPAAGLRRRPEVARLLDALRDLVRAERIEPVDQPPLLGTVYHLVDRGTASLYQARLEGLGTASPALRFAASGPWPPYAFAEEAAW
jgi:hypothetical protein